MDRTADRKVHFLKKVGATNEKFNMFKIRFLQLRRKSAQVVIHLESQIEEYVLSNFAANSDVYFKNTFLKYGVYYEIGKRFFAIFKIQLAHFMKNLLQREEFD